MFPENALKEWKDPRAGVLPFCLKPEVSAHNSWNHLCVWTGLVMFLAQILLSLPSAAGDPRQHPHLFSKILAFATIYKFSHIKLFHYNRKGLDSSFPFLTLAGFPNAWSYAKQIESNSSSEYMKSTTFSSILWDHQDNYRNFSAKKRQNKKEREMVPPYRGNKWRSIRPWFCSKLIVFALPIKQLCQ